MKNDIEFLLIGIEIEFVRKMTFELLVYVKMTTFDCLPSCKILDLIKLVLGPKSSLVILFVWF